MIKQYTFNKPQNYLFKYSKHLKLWCFVYFDRPTAVEHHCLVSGVLCFINTAMWLRRCPVTGSDWRIPSVGMPTRWCTAQQWNKALWDAEEFAVLPRFARTFFVPPWYQCRISVLFLLWCERTCVLVDLMMMSQTHIQKTERYLLHHNNETVSYLEVKYIFVIYKHSTRKSKFNEKSFTLFQTNIKVFSSFGFNVNQHLFPSIEHRRNVWRITLSNNQSRLWPFVHRKTKRHHKSVPYDFFILWVRCPETEKWRRRRWIWSCDLNMSFSMRWPAPCLHLHH